MKAFRFLIFSILLIILLPSVCFATFLGPYSGTVIDSQTGDPVEGASVLIYWQRSIPGPFGSHSELIEARLLYTDTKGFYNIPQFGANLGLLGILESTNVLIYSPGYQAYLVKIWHNNPYAKPNPSFKIKDNKVKLERIPPNFSHRDHYEKIDNALWGIRSLPDFDSSGQHASFDGIVQSGLKSGFLEKQEFLRRVEWEQRRSMREDR